MNKAFTKEPDGDLDSDEEDERPEPAPVKGGNHITSAGFLALKKELDRLWSVERPKVTEEVAVAAAQGDRSENAEYIYGKKQLREIDRRVRYLSKRLDVLTVVERIPDDRTRVYFGAWVEYETEAGEAREVRIVGADEFDPAQHWISVDSPLARALLKRQDGDEVRVQLPEGEATVWIVGIRYGEG